MLHSFWYSAGEKAFRDVLKDDPQCAIATWGIASILMSNPLAGQGASPKGAEAAQAAIDEGRRIGAEDRARARLHRGGRGLLRRLREPLRARSADWPARRRTKRWPSAIPDDDEAQIFSALYTAGTQTQADQTYAAYLKAAAMLERSSRSTPTIRASRTT